MIRFAAVGLGLLGVCALRAGAQSVATDTTGKVSYHHRRAELPDKALVISHSDSTVWFYRGVGGKKPSVYTWRLTTDSTLAGFLALVRSQPKAKYAPEDVLFLRDGLQTWYSIRMSLDFDYTPSGLGYKLTSTGTGKTPEAGKNVSVHYRGYLENGTEFDNSFKRGEPISFKLGIGQVIKGWDEGIQLFPVGSKGTLRIPPDLGYGARGAGGVIPPNATLYFDIEVVSAD